MGPRQMRSGQLTNTADQSHGCSFLRLLAAKLARFDTDRERAVQGQWHAEQLSMGDALFGPARADLCSSWTAG